jgi:hypothetical protein
MIIMLWQRLLLMIIEEVGHTVPGCLSEPHRFLEASEMDR